MLNKIIGLYTHRQQIIAPGTDNIEWTAPPVRRGQIVLITHAAITDYTTANKKLYLGYKDMSGTVYYVSVRKAAQYNQAHLQGSLYLIEGDAPVAGIESPSTSDVISLVIHGEVYNAEG